MRCKVCNAISSGKVPTCLRCRHGRARPEVPTLVLDTPKILGQPETVSGEPLEIQHYLSCPPLVPIWLTESRPLTFGRSCDCDVQLAGDHISRNHAGFVVLDNTAVVCDLGSGNGTFVNEQKIKECRLVPGDVIGIGGWLFVYETKVGSMPLSQQVSAMSKLELFRTKTAG